MTEGERVQYKMMMPADLKARLEDAAHEHRRSLSAEIIARLEASFPKNGSPGIVHQSSINFARGTAIEVPTAQIEEIVERVVRRVREEERERDAE